MILLLTKPQNSNTNVLPESEQRHQLGSIYIPSFQVSDHNCQHQISFYKTVGAEINPDMNINLIGIEIKDYSSEEKILADVMIAEKDAKEVISNLLSMIRDEDLNELLEKRANEMRKLMAEK